LADCINCISWAKLLFRFWGVNAALAGNGCLVPMPRQALQLASNDEFGLSVECKVVLGAPLI
jgi:hypothetical protein